MYTPYVSAEEYATMGHNAVPTASLTEYLIKASRNVDTLTFNRIVGHWDKLTDFQKEIIKEVVCQQADFLYDNKDAIASILDSYSINGVSMHFGTGFNVVIESGLPIQSTTYALLEQTGLCCRLAR